MNGVLCYKCATVVVSLHRHDFKSCPCGDVCVDGGQAYRRRLFMKDAEWEELESVEEVQQAQMETMR